MYKTRNTGMSQVLLIGTDLRVRGEPGVDGDAGNLRMMHVAGVMGKPCCKHTKLGVRGSQAKWGVEDRAISSGQ